MIEKKCQNNWFMEFFISPKYRIYRHLMVLAYMCVFLINSEEPIFMGTQEDIIRQLTWQIYFLLMFYLNMYVFIPVFLYKEKYFLYLFCLITIIISGYLIATNITESHMKGYRFFKGESKNTFDFFITMHVVTMMVFASTSIKLFQRWARDNNKINELEKNSLQIELRELKNQINPHFLFNMLNNVNVLVRKDPEKASNIIMKLSDFLRYQLYDNNQHSILLLSEIQFLNDFMELEKTRRDEFNFSLVIENENEDKSVISNLVLPPNLFISFVENAIKHSIDLDNPSEMWTKFIIFENQLKFICENTKPSETIENSKNSGLGLANIKRRLELLYVNDFTLEIKESVNKYKVTLTLPI
ncbi:sensor histidine kinase YesM [Flavobacterium arsenatis]|uniref:Sensor histidine kinase YesM n=1 Tax=Flavobacterium arsenatis TaxID=1484332 RepID=A0ABU1TN80_9FLAO|nr:histidine kinase [Flavobacterium arsenatis]MDR6967408.1 sensor histidine kinase YesM [Flavobacterium arsenatis]